MRGGDGHVSVTFSQSAPSNPRKRPRHAFDSDSDSDNSISLAENVQQNVRRVRSDDQLHVANLKPDAPQSGAGKPRGVMNAPAAPSLRADIQWLVQHVLDSEIVQFLSTSPAQSTHDIQPVSLPFMIHMGDISRQRPTLAKWMSTQTPVRISGVIAQVCQDLAQRTKKAISALDCGMAACSRACETGWCRWADRIAISALSEGMVLVQALLVLQEDPLAEHAPSSRHTGTYRSFIARAVLAEESTQRVTYFPGEEPKPYVENPYQFVHALLGDSPEHSNRPCLLYLEGELMSMVQLHTVLVGTAYICLNPPEPFPGAPIGAPTLVLWVTHVEPSAQELLAPPPLHTFDDLSLTPPRMFMGADLALYENLCTLARRFGSSVIGPRLLLRTRLALLLSIVSSQPEQLLRQTQALLATNQVPPELAELYNPHLHPLSVCVNNPAQDPLVTRILEHAVSMHPRARMVTQPSARIRQHASHGEGILCISSPVNSDDKHVISLLSDAVATEASARQGVSGPQCVWVEVDGAAWTSLAHIATCVQFSVSGAEAYTEWLLNAIDGVVNEDDLDWPAYLASARMLTVLMSPDASTLLHRYSTAARRVGQLNAREIAALVALAINIARLQLHSEAGIADALFAILVVEENQAASQQAALLKKKKCGGDETCASANLHIPWVENDLFSLDTISRHSEPHLRFKEFFLHVLDFIKHAETANIIDDEEMIAPF